MQLSLSKLQLQLQCWCLFLANKGNTWGSYETSMINFPPERKVAVCSGQVLAFTMASDMSMKHVDVHPSIQKKT